jgi:hypothetical protein
MSSDLQPDARHTNKKMRKKSISRSQKRTSSTAASQQTPQAPDELNAMLGYGTQSSFPLFMAGLVSLIKKAFGCRKT